MPATYSTIVGEKLRNIRLQKRQSLHDVEKASAKEFKASVLGAYERGERSISVPRLERLARFYGVPVDHLLPREEEVVSPGAWTSDKVRIDLVKLGQIETQEGMVLKRYLNMVQIQRGDFNGKVLTIRRDDLRAIASVMDLSSENLMSRIEELGLRAAAG